MRTDRKLTASRQQRPGEDRGPFADTPREKRTKSPEQALAALMRLCARAERSSGDALRLMRTWGVAQEAQQKVLRELLDQRFIDDARYAEAFVREKMRLRRLQNTGGPATQGNRTRARRRGPLGGRPRRACRPPAHAARTQGPHRETRLGL